MPLYNVEVSVKCTMVVQADDHRARYARTRIDAEKSTQPATANYPHGSMGEEVEG